MDNSRIYLIADPHFNHKNIIKYCDRPFSSVDEMNQVLIKNWNNTVKKEDRIFVLGDFCLSGKDKIIEIGRQLKGRKTLILGNHDSASIKTYYEAGFEMVSKYPIIIENFFILSHEPKFVLDLGLYYNIYGHLHKNKEILDFTCKTACISLERTDYKPISFEKVKNEMISRSLTGGISIY